MIKIKDLRPESIFSKPNPPSQSRIWDKEITFEQGKQYLIKAVSGGGKSTFLHILFGLRKDYKGIASINGLTVSKATQDEIATIRRNELSIVFQDLKLLPEMTALENIEATRSLHTHTTKKELQIMMDKLGVTEFANQTVQTLSYGQRQRVAIIRALVRPFSFLLLDEPFSHLDQGNISVACELIQEQLVAQNAGLLLVAHESAYDFSVDAEFLL